MVETKARKGAKYVAMDAAKTSYKCLRCGRHVGGPGNFGRHETWHRAVAYSEAHFNDLSG